MTTLNDTQKIATGAAMCLAWDAVEYDYEPIALGIDLTASWGSLAHVERMHLKEVARHLVSHLVDDEIIALIDDDQLEYETCKINDYEEGDMARVTDGEDVYEFRVTSPGATLIQGSSITVSERGYLKFERAPKPIAIPDPEVHKYIVDHEDHDRIYEAKWDANYLEDRYYGTGSDVGVPPRLFTDWTFVKLVPVEEED